MILIISLSRLFSAARNLAASHECDAEDPEHKVFKSLAIEVYEILIALINASAIKDAAIRVQ